MFAHKPVIIVPHVNKYSPLWRLCPCFQPWLRFSEPCSSHLCVCILSVPPPLARRDCWPLFCAALAPHTISHRCQQVSAERANLLKHYRAAGNLPRPHKLKQQGHQGLRRPTQTERSDSWVKRERQTWNNREPQSEIWLERQENDMNVDQKCKHTERRRTTCLEGTSLTPFCSSVFSVCCWGGRRAFVVLNPFKQDAQFLMHSTLVAVGILTPGQPAQIKSSLICLAFTCVCMWVSAYRTCVCVCLCGYRGMFN